MLKFRDPQSNIQLAEAELTYKEAVNGEKSLTGTIYSNDEVLHQMERGWSVMFNGDWYYITYVAPTDGGNSITVEFDAVHEFFFKMSKSVAYGTLKDGSHTAKEYLDFVFNGSGYSYTLLSQVDAWEKQSFGDKNRLALFNDLISDMEMEFSIADSGRIMITSEIGQDLSTIVRKGFNLQELNLEYNVSDFVTYAKGFGAFIDKDDESKGRYEAEYTSPLASVYGKLEADPITDERYTKTASLQAALKKAVDSSYSISVGISLEELQNAGYDYESPVPGDYILAVDEQLDFNQRIRIISVEEQYNIYGERISSNVEAGSLSATKQKLDGSESNSVVLALSHATEQADNAVKTANGKNTSYSGPNQPQNPREGDMWWYDNGSGTSFMKQYTNGEWVILIDSNTKQNIEKAVDSAIETSHTYTDELNEKQVQTTNALSEKVDKSVKELTDSQQAISSQATAYTDSAVADANSKAASIGQSAAQNAQSALDTAKQDFTSSFASQASQTASMASEANLKASQYASQAKSEAVSAATSADGLVRTEFKSTTDSMTATIQQNKSDADGKISTAQTTATQALDGLATKVEKTEYNKTTGELTTKINETKDTAEQSKQDIVDIKDVNSKQDERMLEIEKDAKGIRQTVSDLSTEQGKQSGSISKLEQRADGFDATVTKVDNLAVGGRNLLVGTKNFDGEGWKFSGTSLNQSDFQELTSASVTGAWLGPKYYNSVLEKQGKITSTSTQYVLSAWVNNTGTIPIGVGFFSNETSPAYYDIGKLPANSGWVRIATKPFSFRKTTGLLETIRFEPGADIQGGVLKQAGLKLEEGNVATDWTPAPEDVSSATAKAQLTADKATLSINNYKTDADGRISKAQADIKLNADAISTKVEKSDYDKKTGELTTSVNTAQQTADEATQTIGTYKESNDRRVQAAETNIKANSDAIEFTASKTELDQVTGKLSGDISTLQQRADGFEATATKVNNLSVGGRNLLLDTGRSFTGIGNNSDNGNFDWQGGKYYLSGGKTLADLYNQYGPSQYLTLSFDWEVSGDNISGQFSPQWSDTPWLGLAEVGAIKPNNSNKSGRFKNSVQLNHDGYSTGIANGVMFRQDNLQGNITIKNLKLETGNIATDWTSAPEDIDTQLAQVKITADGVNTVVSDPTTGLSTRMQKAEGALSTVSGTDIPALKKVIFWQPYSSLNFNDYTKQGSFFFNTTATKTNGPTSSNSWIYLIVDQGTSDNSRIKQTAWYDGVDGVKITYARTLNSGTWSPWYANDNDSVTTISQTNSSIQREIADRKTGDSNTLQAGKDFTTSQITSYDTGMQSRLSQVSDGIMAQVSATNLIVDSSFVNALTNWILSGDVNWKIDTGNMHEGVRVAKFDNGDTVFDRKTATLTSVPIYTMNLGGTQFYASFDLYAKSFGTSAYFKAEIVQKNSSGITTKTTAVGGSFDTAMSDWTNYTANITLDPATTQLYLQFTQYGGGVIYVSRPYLGSVQLQKNAYIAGASTDNSSTLKLFNNFFAFGIQANTGALIAGINGDSSGLNIVGEKITITGDTTFIGKNFMDGALIKNASIGTAQIADVSITNAKIASLDVNKISGNVSNFIQSNWNGKYGSTTIDANGMKVDTNGVNTQFGSSGMTLNMTGESIGGIGVQGFAGKPSDYQGLTFWLDGKAEYMAWGARDSGATSGNPITKLGWFRSGSNPIGTHAGFNFDDDVIFNKGVRVSGAAKAKLAFSTKTFLGNNYPFFGNEVLNAGLAYGGTTTYLISQSTYYNLTRVIAALDNLGAVKIPSVINSDGTVAKWFNVTL
ncbi:phage tail protein [Weissella cibaria]|uniref:phage tail protein n=1 Tax=Weissella cibaria TaxID=137591 RepID=UPI000706936E|nr:phage tail protein [Weissella cibaria]ALI33174.1 hypothetical protein AO080_06805 [Weissella cibaria]